MKLSNEYSVHSALTPNVVPTNDNAYIQYDFQNNPNIHTKPVVAISGGDKGDAFFEDIPIRKMPVGMMLDGIGFYGPIIVIAIICIALHKQPKYMWIYVVFIFINNYLNRGLKLIIVENRPSKPIPFSKYENYKHAEMYGMPSGHASAIGFSIIYLFLVKGYGYWLIICMFIGILTMYQRWKYRRHTAEQVVVGFITGSIAGWLVYTVTTQWIIWI